MPFWRKWWVSYFQNFAAMQEKGQEKKAPQA
jgi:hypothetical protein